MSKKETRTGASKRMISGRLKWLSGIGAFLMIALALAYWRMPVNIATPKAFAASGNELEKLLQSRAKMPAGYQISLFAQGLERPRLMIATPTGDLIVSSRGSQIFLVDGKREARTLMRGLNQPHGVLLHNDWLYVAEEHRVFRIQYNVQKGTVSGKPQTVVSGLPDNGGHSSRTLKKGPDGWFYLTIGSSCNVCRERHKWRAAMIRFHPDKKDKPQIHATGLRNTVGFDWQPGTGRLYGVDNGRDWLGDEFPPDELNQINKGGFYGWPYRHGNNVPDDKYGRGFNGQAEVPAFPFEAHIAPLSIRFLRHQKNRKMQNIALVGQHGSWNRSKKRGYRIVSLQFKDDGTIERKMFLTGFLKNGEVIGRPVDVLERKDGSLLISDDYAGVIWLVTYGG